MRIVSLPTLTAFKNTNETNKSYSPKKFCVIALLTLVLLLLLLPRARCARLTQVLPAKYRQGSHRDCHVLVQTVKRLSEFP
jgi:hypothetical protein